MHNNSKRKTHLLIFIVFNLLASCSPKAQPSIQNICGVYQPAKKGESNPLLQITYIDKDTYWLYYNGLLQAVKPVQQGLNWELVPVQKSKDQFKLIYTDSTLLVQTDSTKTLYKKFKLPAAAATIFNPGKTIKQQLYEANESNRALRLSANYIEINSDFQISYHEFKDGSETCRPFFMVIDINEPMTVKDAGTCLVFRAFKAHVKEFEICKPLDMSKTYEIDDREVEGCLYFNKEGELKMMLCAGYMSALLFVNKNYSMKDILELMENVPQPASY